MISFIYLSKKYIKNFLIIAFALSFFATLIDLVSHIASLDGFNKKILYSFYIFEDILHLIYPMALVLGAILTYYQLIIKNHLLAFGSFSYDKKRLVKTFLLLSILIYLIFIALDFTPFAYAHANAGIVLRGNGENSINQTFFKYNNSFVYADRLNVVNREFENVKIYKIKDLKLQEIIEFKKAKFQKDRWIANDVTIKKFEYNGTKPLGFKVQHQDKIAVLKGYYPKVIKLLYEGKRIDLANGIKALKLLNSQQIDNTKVLSALYAKVLMPLIAPFLIVIFFSFTPLHRRALNLGKYLFWTMGSTIILWLVLYSLNTLSQSATIDPNFLLPVVISILFAYTTFVWFRNINKL